MVKLSSFNFDFDEKLVAQHPIDFRDESRLMVLHRETGEIEHRYFNDFVDYFGDGDVVIANNTQVFPARLHGKKEKTGAKIEVLLLRELNPEIRLWDVLVDPARKIRVGNKLYFGEEENEPLVAEVVDNTTSRGRTIRFLFDGSDNEFYVLLNRLGETPLPNYINRQAEDEDRDSYQTIFAKNTGAIAAPAAGLHVSRKILKWFEIKGIDLAEITLHIGMGSFRPIEVEDLSKHKMDSENYRISKETSDKVNKALENRNKVCAIGTSSLRAIESSVSANSYLNPKEGWTEKFIFPPYKFNIANSIITNFHQPKSAFLITATAFAGFDLMKRAYAEAVKEKYRFLDYGDAMLII
ncbi:MAG: tRNA preQ1(34) S-adenosylmethionine ribosyltransferase-isomerase QueA [Bacteroidetes bacterium SW_10_40_5]|nr:MAG: tRNA preQ1(34) S-adenosylmethionine ribosyltransferase-isomerase QueA [Bacteroidetes bacterium SW_10_40_5]